jgi:hypothetical protein
MSTRLYGEPLSYIGQDNYKNSANTYAKDHMNTSYTKSGGEYHVVFKIVYESKYFEDLFVVGGHPDLGNE